MSKASASSSRPQVPRWKYILALVLAGLVVVLVIQNAATVEVQFLFWRFAMPRAVLILVVLGVGFLLGSLWRARRGRRRA